ncbi:MAG: hypothetical protein KAH48_09815 [Chlorobi bacterium]|nr:hypothetical protein [Chlorobiota bacterium]
MLNKLFVLIFCFTQVATAQELNHTDLVAKQRVYEKRVEKEIATIKRLLKKLKPIERSKSYTDRIQDLETLYHIYGGKILEVLPVFNTEMKPLREFGSLLSKVETIEQSIFVIQRDLPANEFKHIEMMKKRRSYLDKYDRLEVTIEVQISEIISKLSEKLVVQLPALEAELKMIKSNIELYLKIASLNNINSTNIYSILDEFYKYITENNFTDEQKILIRIANDTIVAKVLPILKSMSNDALLSFVKNGFKKINSTYSSPLLGSITAIKNNLEIIADNNCEKLLGASFSYDGSIPIININLENTNKLKIQDSFFIRKTPITTIEINLYLLSLSDYNFVLSLYYLRSDSRKIINGFAEKYKCNFVSQNDKKYIVELYGDSKISRDYKYVLSDLFEHNKINDFEYFKVNSSKFPTEDEEKANAEIDKYWAQTYPRRLIVKYSFGIPFDYMLNTNSIKEFQANYFGYGSEANSITFGFRFRNDENIDGNDEDLVYIGLKLSSITNTIFKAYTTLYKSKSYENITDIEFSSTDIQLVYNSGKYFEIGIGYGSCSYKEIFDPNDPTSVKWDNTGFGVFSMGLSIPVFDFMSWDFQTRFNVPIVDDKVLFHGSVLTSLSFYLPFGRF